MYSRVSRTKASQPKRQVHESGVEQHAPVWSSRLQTYVFLVDDDVRHCAVGRIQSGVDSKETRFGPQYALEQPNNEI